MEKYTLKNFFSEHQKKIVKELTRKKIIISTENIEQILKETSFEKRSQENPKECTCYATNTPCHNLEELNCFLCGCPEYSSELQDGGCKINNPKGFFYQHSKGQVWDCSNCFYPHKKEIVRIYLKKNINELRELQKRLTKKN